MNPNYSLHPGGGKVTADSSESMPSGLKDSGKVHYDDFTFGRDGNLKGWTKYYDSGDTFSTLIVSNLKSTAGGGYKGTGIKDNDTKNPYEMTFDADYNETSRSRTTKSEKNELGYIEYKRDVMTPSSSTTMSWLYDADNFNGITDLNKSWSGKDASGRTVTSSLKAETTSLKRMIGDSYIVPAIKTTTVNGKADDTLGGARYIMMNPDTGETGRYSLDVEDNRVTRTDRDTSDAPNGTTYSWGAKEDSTGVHVDFSSYNKSWKGANGEWAKLTATGSVKQNDNGTATFAVLKESSSGEKMEFTITVDSHGNEISRTDAKGKSYDSTGALLES